jgi:hypothetical protein
MNIGFDGLKDEFYRLKLFHQLMIKSICLNPNACFWPTVVVFAETNRAGD